MTVVVAGVRAVGIMDPRRVLIEQYADEIERDLGERLTRQQRIGLERRLDRFLDEVRTS